MKPNRLWLGIFGIWGIFLSGALSSVIGSPGILQAAQLERILDGKQRQIDDAENQVIALQDEVARLEKSKLTQEREIRRVLGYAAPNELIFDFSRDESSPIN